MLVHDSTRAQRAGQLSVFPHAMGSRSVAVRDRRMASAHDTSSSPAPSLCALPVASMADASVPLPAEPPQGRRRAAAGESGGQLWAGNVLGPQRERAPGDMAVGEAHGPPASARTSDAAQGDEIRRRQSLRAKRKPRLNDGVLRGLALELSRAQPLVLAAVSSSSAASNSAEADEHAVDDALRSVLAVRGREVCRLLA